MIRIIKNANLPQWFQVILTDSFGFADVIDEVRGKAKAMRIAKKLARKEKVNNVNVDGFIMPTEEL
jgi:hypothetical protein